MYIICTFPRAAVETPSLMFGKKTEQDLSQSQDTEAGHFDSSDIHSFDALEGISV